MGRKTVNPLSFEAHVKHVEGVINFRTIFEYDWRISLAGDPITEDELSILAKASEPLVKIRDRWLDMRNRKMRERLSSPSPSGVGTAPLPRSSST